MSISVNSIVPLSATENKKVNITIEKHFKNMEKLGIKIIKDGKYFKLDSKERAFFKGRCYKRGSNTFLKVFNQDFIIFDNNINVEIKDINILMLDDNILYVIG